MIFCPRQCTSPGVRDGDILGYIVDIIKISSLLKPKPLKFCFKFCCLKFCLDTGKTLYIFFISNFNNILKIYFDIWIIFIFL